MKRLGLVLLPALLAGLVQAELQLLPGGDQLIHDLTLGYVAPVFVSCLATDKSVVEAQLRWFDHNDMQITATQGSTFVVDEGDELVLRLASPSSDQSGRYTCKGVIDGKEQEISKQITLYGGIEVLSPSVQYAVNGTDAKLMCKTARTRAQKKTWYIGEWSQVKTGGRYEVGHSVDGDVDEGYLTVFNVTLEDSDRYICSIDIRTLGKSHAHFINLTVTVPPEFDGDMVVEPMVVKEGDHVELSCSAQGIPDPTFIFRKDDRDLTDVLHKGRYVIQNISRNDEGDYMCEATNQGGSKSVSATVDVKIPPTMEPGQDLTEEQGKSVRIPCIATGDSAPVLSWRREHSDDPITDDNMEKLYVEEETENLEQNPLTKEFRRVLYLVISKLEPSHSGTYICKAENDVGAEEMTSAIEVTYQPIFDEKAESKFYGWLGSNTNLTCVANGNPKPEITWSKDGLDLSMDPSYEVEVEGDSEPSRTVSYLIPAVDDTNRGTVFGNYKCEAKNSLGTNEVELEFKLAEIPGEPVISVMETKPTELVLRLRPPEEEGGQPVYKYVVAYGKADNSENATTKEFFRVGDEDETSVTLDDLVPNTPYSIAVEAVNNVGAGDEKTVVETTADYSIPDPVMVTSNRLGEKANTYVLQWDVPSTGGADIKHYMVVHAAATEVDMDKDPWEATKVSPDSVTNKVDGAKTMITLDNLKKDTFYQVKIKAVNRIGSSDESTFVFKTSEMEDREEATAQSIKGGPMMGGAGAVGLVVVLVVIVLIVVDVVLYKTKKCGVTWTVSRLMARQKREPASPEHGDEASTKLLGKEKEDTLRTENEVSKDANTAETTFANGTHSDDKTAEKTKPDNSPNAVSSPADSGTKPSQDKAVSNPADSGTKPPQDKAANSREVANNAATDATKAGQPADKVTKVTEGSNSIAKETKGSTDVSKATERANSTKPADTASNAGQPAPAGSSSAKQPETTNTVAMATEGGDGGQEAAPTEVTAAHTGEKSLTEGREDASPNTQVAGNPAAGQEAATTASDATTTAAAASTPQTPAAEIPQSSDVKSDTAAGQ